LIPLKDDNPTYRTPIVTYSIIAICVIVFILEITSSSYNNGRLFYSYGLIPAVFTGQATLPDEIAGLPSELTLLSSMFMHGGFMHLIGNMLYMWIFADNIEDEIGPVRFIIFYVLAGIAAALTQVYLNTSSTIPMIGASGAIGGVLGAYIVNHPKAKVLVLIPLGFFSQIIKIPALYVLGFWFVLQFINSSLSSSTGGGVAYGAHIGGFIFGVITILFFNKKSTVQKVSNNKPKNPWAS